MVLGGNMWLKLSLIVILLVSFSGCTGKGGKGGEILEKISISSSAFEDGAAIPSRYTCDGEDVSPALSWGEMPSGTKSIALISDDPDAPVGTFTHWVIYNIPPDKNGLPEGVDKKEQLSDGSLQGVNDFNKIGYNGPCPPPGKPHRYYFKVYALDTKLDLTSGASKGQVESAMEGHILAIGEIIGKYGR
jgi:hypothetical protein